PGSFYLVAKSIVYDQFSSRMSNTTRQTGFLCFSRRPVPISELPFGYQQASSCDRMLMSKANFIVMVLALSIVVSARGAAGIALEANAQWQMEFSDLPVTLATMSTGQRQPPRLTVRLPANYSRERKFPLFAFLNGADGGRGDTLPRDPKTIGSNDFICASLPLFKRAFHKTDGLWVTVDDVDTASRPYRVRFPE